MKRVAVLLALAGFAVTAFGHEPPSVTTIILVRHAEKNPDPALKDPELTADGIARALELVRVLGTTPVDAVFTTPYQRTRGTAKPFAESRKLTPVEIPGAATYAADVVAWIRREHSGGTVLVVGHSNTTQHVIRELGVADAPKIEESTYDNLFIVTLVPGAEPRLISLRYGKEVR